MATNSLDDAMKLLKAAGESSSAPQIDFSGWNNLPSMAPTIKFDPSVIANPNAFVATPPKSSGNGLVASIGNVLNNTIGQAEGYVANTVDDAIKNWKSDKGSTLKKVSDLVGSIDPLSVPINAVVNQVKDWGDGKLNAKDIPGAGLVQALGQFLPTESLAQGISKGAQAQWKDWTDGKFTWGDVPSFGFLNGMGQGWARGSNIMSDLGVNNRWGNVGGGLALDIALDPTTYLTGGLSAASKIADAAKLSKMAEVGKDLGIVGKIKTDAQGTQEFMNSVADALHAKYDQKFAQYPNLAANLKDKTIINQFNDIANSIDKAHADAFNANINKIGFKAPFMNKYALKNMSPKNPLYRTEATVPMDVTNNLINGIAKTPEEAQKIADSIKANYGVQDLADLTKSQFEHLADNLSSYQSNVRPLPDASIEESMVNKNIPQPDTVTYNKTTPDELLSQMDPRVAAKVAPLVNGLKDVNDIRKLGPDAVKMFGEFAPKIMRTVKGKTAEEVKNAFNDAAMVLKNATHTGEITKSPDKVVQELQRLVEIHKTGNPELKSAQKLKEIDNLLKNPSVMSDGKTNFEHWLDKRNPFEARTLKTGNKFLDSMANHVQDANSAQIGNKAKYAESMNKISHYIKQLSKVHGEGSLDNVMREAIYHLENKAPMSYPKGWKAPEEAQNLANLMKPVLDSIARDEKASGVLKSIRQDYFPHVVNKEAQAKEINDFMKRHGTIGNKSAKNAFDQARQTFPTIADVDNYIAKLEKDVQNTKDDATIESIRQQQDRVANLFDTNVVSALQRRIREGIRASAMKEMQGKLSKFGMLRTGDPKGNNALVKLSSEQAKKFGLNPDQEHFIHPKVMDAMRKVDDIFTDEGMNKFVRHMTAFADAWRPLMTYYKPTHYVNNIIGNVINNMAAGVKANDYRMAKKLIQGYRKGKLTDAQMNLMNKAYNKNVLSGGFLFDGKRTFQGQAPDTKLDKLAEKITENKAIHAVRKKGEIVDDYARLANFLNGLDKYNGNVEKAANQVRTYLFNYNEMTGTDRAMRLMIPFWNWMKRNVPLQVKALMENPKFAMNNVRFFQLFNQNENGRQWQKDTGIHVPQAISNLLGAKGTEYYTSIPDPMNDLGQLMNPVQSLLGGLHPLPKAAIELSTNKNLYTGNPISYGSNNVQMKDAIPYLINSFLGGKNLTDAATGAKSVPESLINFFKSISKVNPKGQPAEVIPYGGG